VTSGLLLGLGACFQPSPASGVPCDPAAPYCPSGQACIRQRDGFVCGTGAGDQPDAYDSDDDDGDGVLDLADNCPLAPNAPQANYDGDRFGDACDPCPPLADDAPIDRDTDGVADACDPDPVLPGDHIVLFDAFRDGLAAWTPTGTWTVGADGVGIDLTHGAQASLVRPISVATRTSVITAFTADATRTLAGYAGMGAVVGVEPDRNVHCAVVRNPTTGEHVALIDTKAESALAATDFALELGEVYTSQVTATTLGYRCRAAGLEVAASGTAALAVGLRARATRGTFHWILVVGIQ
jgi:hypothetical protein